MKSMKLKLDILCSVYRLIVHDHCENNCDGNVCFETDCLLFYVRRSLVQTTSWLEPFTAVAYWEADDRNEVEGDVDDDDDDDGDGDEEEEEEEEEGKVEEEEEEEEEGRRKKNG